MSQIEVTNYSRSTSPSSVSSLYKEPESHLCKRCGQYIYPLELMGSVMGFKYHKQCFRCQTCDRVLDFKTYKTNMIDLNDKHIYCINHYPRSGKYTEVAYSYRSRSKSPGNFIETSEHSSKYQKEVTISESSKFVYGRMPVDLPNMNSGLYNRLERKNSIDLGLDSISFDRKSSMDDEKQFELKKSQSKEQLYDRNEYDSKIQVIHSNNDASNIITNSVLKNDSFSEMNKNSTNFSASTSANNSVSTFCENSNSRFGISDIVERNPVILQKDESPSFSSNKFHDIKMELKKSLSRESLFDEISSEKNQGNEIAKKNESNNIIVNKYSKNDSVSEMKNSEMNMSSISKSESSTSANSKISSYSESNQSSVAVNSTVSSLTSTSYSASSATSSSSKSLYHQNAVSNYYINELPERISVLPIQEDSSNIKIHDIKINIENDNKHKIQSSHNNNDELVQQNQRDKWENLSNIIVDILKHDAYINRPVIKNDKNNRLNNILIDIMEKNNSILRPSSALYKKYPNLCRIINEVNAFYGNQADTYTDKSEFNQVYSSNSSNVKDNNKISNLKMIFAEAFRSSY